MKFRLILLAAMILSLMMSTAPAKISLAVSHELSPGEIWYLDPGSMPGMSHANITVTGESVLEDASVEVILAIDSSGSMGDNDPENKRLAAAKIFVGMMNTSRDKVGMVSWDDNIDFFVAPTNNFLYVNNSIDRVDSSGSTDMDEGLRKSIDLLSSGRHDARLIVLLSDGSNSDYTPSGRRGSQADRARDEGIAIYTIGLSLDDSDAEVKLKDVAKTTGGRYYSAPDIDILRSIYEDIGNEVVNLAGKNVKVRCAIPPEVAIRNYAVKPSSESFEGDFRIMTWNVETIAVNDTWTTSFDVITKKVEETDEEDEEPDVFGSELDISYVQDGKSLANLTFKNKSLSQMGITSVVSMNVSLSADLDVIRERVGAIYDLIEVSDTRIVWMFAETTGDWAFLLEDGRLVIASTADFDLSTKALLTGELLLSVNQLNAVGANITSRNGTAYGLMTYNVTDAKLVENVVYYAEHVGVYQYITYEFNEKFDLNLVVPDCPIREARLIVEGREYDCFGGAANQKYYVDGIYIAGCEFHDFPWTGWCAVNETEITDEITPGTHRFSSSDIAEPHTLTLEVVTASPPSKKFFLYSDDLTSVWVPAVANRPI